MRVSLRSRPGASCSRCRWSRRSISCSLVTDAAINRTLSPDSAGGRKLARQLGIEPRRLGLIGKLTSGIVRALFVLIVLALAIGRWEVAAADLLEAIKGVSFGIRIGDFTISFGAVFGAIVLFGHHRGR